MIDFSPNETAAAARAVVKLFDLWRLNDHDAAGCLRLSGEDWDAVKAGDIASLDNKTAERLSRFLGIHASLRQIFGDTARSNAWIKKPNDALAGLSALDFIKNGGHGALEVVRRYLAEQEDVGCPAPTEIAGLKTVLAAMHHGVHPLTVAGFLTTPQPDLEDEHGEAMTPIAWLLAGKDPRTVADLAQWI